MKNNVITVCLSLVMSINLLGMKKKDRSKDATSFNRITEIIEAKKFIQQNKPQQAIKLLRNFRKSIQANTHTYVQLQYLLSKAYLKRALQESEDISEHQRYLAAHMELLSQLTEQNISQPLRAKANYKLGDLFSRPKLSHLGEHQKYFKNAEEIATKIGLQKIVILSKSKRAPSYLTANKDHIKYCHDILKIINNMQHAEIILIKLQANIALGAYYKKKDQTKKAETYFERIINTKTDHFTPKTRKKYKNVIKGIENLKTATHFVLSDKKITKGKKKRYEHLRESLKNQKLENFTKYLIENPPPEITDIKFQQHFINNSIKERIAQNHCNTCKKTTDELIDTQKFKKCSKCKLIYYCSRECQVKDWPKHKEICQEN